MSAELRRLQEQRDAFIALAKALGTQDGWLSYRAEALRDQLLEHEGQATARPPPSSESAQPSSIGMRRCSRRGGLERMRTAVTNWETEVVAARSDNQELRAWLREAQAQQSQAEERARAAEQRAREADELRPPSTPRLPRLPRRRTSSGRSVPPARGSRRSSSGSGPLLPMPSRRLSGSVPLARRCRSRWQSGRPTSQGSTGSS
jgi:hypothetical protein